MHRTKDYYIGNKDEHGHKSNQLFCEFTTKGYTNLNA